MKTGETEAFCDDVTKYGSQPVHATSSHPSEKHMFTAAPVHLQLVWLTVSQISNNLIYQSVYNTSEICEMYIVAWHGLQ